MEKAHLYEALYLVNHGIDEAVRGVVERERKLEGKPPLVQFLAKSKGRKITGEHPEKFTPGLKANSEEEK